MCKVLYILNKNNPNTEAGKLANSQLADLVKAQENEFKSERDGYSVYRNGRTFNYPTIEHYDRIGKNTEYRNEPVYCAHFRTSTGGSEDGDGLHLQKLYGRYVYAHNGTVWGFNQVKKKSDSHYFFSRLIQRWGEINYPNVNEAIDKYSFHGKGFLYDEKEKTTYFFCNQPAWIYILNDAFVIASYEINRKFQQYTKHTVLNYDWYTAGDSRFLEGIQHSEKLDDVYMEFKDGVFQYSMELEKKTGYQYNARDENEVDAEYTIYAEQYFNENGIVPTEKQLDDWIVKTFNANPKDLEEMKQDAIEKENEDTTGAGDIDETDHTESINEQLRIDNLGRKGNKKAQKIIKRLQEGSRGKDSHIDILPNGVVMHRKGVQAD